MTTQLQKLLTKYDAACDHCIETMVGITVWFHNADANAISKGGYSGISSAAAQCDAYGTRLHKELQDLYDIGVELCAQIKLLTEEVNKLRLQQTEWEAEEIEEKLAAIVSDSKNVHAALARIRNISNQGAALLDGVMLPFLQKLSEVAIQL